MAVFRSVWLGDRIPASIELPPNILSFFPTWNISSKQETLVLTNRSRLDETQRTTIEFSHITCTGRDLTPLNIGGSITLRFFGPLSDYLTLRLIHCCAETNHVLQLESQHFTHPIPQSDSPVLQDIRIVMQKWYTIFWPHFRNMTPETLAVVIRNGFGNIPHDIELLE